MTSENITRWLKSVQLGKQPQYENSDYGGLHDVFSAHHETDGITMLVQKPVGKKCAYMFQLGVGPNFKLKYYTDNKIEKLLQPLGELIDKRRNYMKSKPRKSKRKKSKQTT